MLRKFRLLLFLSFLVAGMTEGTVWGAELQAAIDTAKQSVTLANTLQHDLYVMHLEGAGSSYPVMVRVAAGSKVEVSFKGKELPATLSSAACIFSRPDRLPEEFSYERGGDGLYHLSVETL